MKRFPIFAALAAILVVGTLGWMVWEVGHPAVTVEVLHAHSLNWSAVWHPSRTMIAYHAFLVAVSLLPPLYFAGILRDRPRSAPRRAPMATASSGTLFVFALCLAGILTGYFVEGLRSEIQLTSDSLAYRAGSERAVVSRAEVRGMRLRAGRQAQTLDLIASGKTVRIDLSAFGLADRAVLVRQLPLWAKLTQAYSRRADEMVWVRAQMQETQ